MTILATSPVNEPDLLALVADDWTPLGRTAADRFRDACRAEALVHDGRVDPNGVRERLLVGGVLDIDPRTYSALWSTACAGGGYLAKTDELVPIAGEGSMHNGGKSVRVRRWIAPLTPGPDASLGKIADGPGHSSPGGRDRSTRSLVADPVAPSPATGAVRFPADRQGARQYGPHDPTSAPTTGTVRCGAGTRSGSSFCAQPGCRQEHEVPLHPGLVAQRRRINELAARQ